MTLVHFSSRYYFKIFIKLNLKILQVFDLYLACPLFISYASVALSRSVFSKTRVIVWTQILFFASRAWPVSTPSLWPLLCRLLRLRHEIGIFLQEAGIAKLHSWIKVLSVSIHSFFLAILSFKVTKKISASIPLIDLCFVSFLFFLETLINAIPVNSLPIKLENIAIFIYCYLFSLFIGFQFLQCNLIFLLKLLLLLLIELFEVATWASFFFRFSVFGAMVRLFFLAFCQLFFDIFFI